MHPCKQAPSPSSAFSLFGHTSIQRFAICTANWRIASTLAAMAAGYALRPTGVSDWAGWNIEASFRQ